MIWNTQVLYIEVPADIGFKMFDHFLQVCSRYDIVHENDHD